VPHIEQYAGDALTPLSVYWYIILDLITRKFDEQNSRALLKTYSG